MTRKQALSLAVQALAEAGRNSEAVDILRVLSDELPLTRWSDAAIRDAVEQFILDHGRVPTATDFKRRGLPPHTVVERRYGMPLRRWLDENYPRPQPCRSPHAETDTGTEAASDTAAINRAFTDDYLRLRPRSAAAFNAGRTPDTPCWQTVAKHNRTRRWRGLLEALALPVYPDADRDGPADFRVRIHPHCDFRED